MPEPRPLSVVAERLKVARESRGLSPEDVDTHLGVGPGWTALIESGREVPRLDFIMAMGSAVGLPAVEMFSGLKAPTVLRRDLWAEQATSGDGIILHFPYGRHDAAVPLANATLADFEQVLSVLRTGLANLAALPDPSDERARAIQTKSVASTFLQAATTWPHANPSDLWWFLVYRAYCDPLNHPATHARLDFGQSWKRTGGWALERVLVAHYGPALREAGLDIVIPDSDRKAQYQGQLQQGITHTIEGDKIDVFLIGHQHGKEICFGVVHVKASFAERRTDDVPMSEALMGKGYLSPLWTMDCKGSPAAHPVNAGELGPVHDGTSGPDRRSAKRRDFEVNGYFSACFSYNANTIPTPPSPETRGRVIVCNFNDPKDAFHRFVVNGWATFCERNH